MIKLLTAKHDPIRKIFPFWDEIDPETREDIRNCLANGNKMWAHRRLVNAYGLSCDGTWCGCNSFSPEEIAAEKENQ